VVEVDREAWADVMGVAELDGAGEAPKPREKKLAFRGSSFAGGVTIGSGRSATISIGGGMGESE